MDPITWLDTREIWLKVNARNCDLWCKFAVEIGSETPLGRKICYFQANFHLKMDLLSMLVAFNVGNFKSIKEEQTFSMVKSAGMEKSQDNVIDTISLDGSPSLSLLKSVALYGPNASGKSTLVDALAAMRRIVMTSATNQVGSGLPIVPFALAKDTPNSPTLFEVVFIQDKIRYQYGFQADSQRIHSEWLYAYPKGRSQKWFSREYDEKNKKFKFDFGDKLKGARITWESSTRADALLLSTAVQLNSEQLKPVYDWFKLNVKLMPRFSDHVYTAKRSGSEFKSRVLGFMQAADFAIADFQIDQNSYSLDSFPVEMPEEIRSFLYEAMKDDNEYKVSLIHTTDEGKYELPFEVESDGTRRMFNICGHWLDALDEGRILVVDELHDKLHPYLVKFLVEAFHNPDLNSKGAQLIFTTHETAILSQNVFRRDQIWFAERDSNQSSKFYPLTDFSPKKGQDNLERSYLGGRYGAVPSIKKMISIFYGAK